MSTPSEQETPARSRRSWAIIAGPALALVVYFFLPEVYTDIQGGQQTFSHAGRATTAIAVWMAVWWLTEAISIYATALVPLAAFPMTGASSIAEASAPYANNIIFLFMGGFFMALAMQRWNLHRRIALVALSMVGERPSHMIGGFMVVAAVLSMWVSNTATAVMMLPVALSVIELVDSKAQDAWSDLSRNHFAIALLLGIAYSCSVGGMVTPIGTPPNLFLVSFADETLGVEVSFVRWMMMGIPLALVFLPIIWWLLTARLHPVPTTPVEGGREMVRRELQKLGSLSRGERVVFVVFCSACLSWVFRPLLDDITIAGFTPLAGLSDAGIAMIAAMLLFAIPVDPSNMTLDWETAVKLPWGILLLFGGGLSLAGAIASNGVSEWLGAQSASLNGLPSVLMVLAVVTGMVFLTELTSNTASAAALIPILAAIAPGLGIEPLVLALPATFAACCAFMLPVATPPNAVVFGSGRVGMREMARAGLLLNFISIVLITILTFVLARPLLSGLQ